MKKLLLITAAFLPSLAFAASPPAKGRQPILPPIIERTEELRDAALREDMLAWEITEGLTTEVGQRLAGTEAEDRARDWAVAKLKSLGFQNVRVEPFEMSVWVRGEERAEIVAPFPQKLVVAALGNSAATPAEGITAEIIGFDSLADLGAADDASVRGKIVFVSHAMVPTQDGVGYGYYGPIRRSASTVASRKGAIAVVIRSLGTDYHRNPHTGGQSIGKDTTPIPAGALSIPDAEQLQRILKRGKPVTMHLTLTPHNIGMRQSGNVIAEIPGRDPNAGIVLIGGHLDSWDLGTGAIDDAAGVAITTAAAKRIMDAGQPLRTIRIVWFGAEEVGLFGGREYMNHHKDEKHVVIAESDLGADRIWRFDSRLSTEAQPVVDKIARVLFPLGIVKGSTDKAGGSDISLLSDTGVPTIELQQDATRYFDLHHTPDDTLDKIDLQQLRQNVAAWTAMLAIAANDPLESGPAPVKGK
jgi:hypothetical protein